MSKMGTASKVKVERIRSLFKQDGVFRDDDDLKRQVGNMLKTKDVDTYMIQAGIDGFRFTSVPDKKGYAEVEVSFKPNTTWRYDGTHQLGGGAKMKKKTSTVPRKKLKLKIMNI